MFSHIGMLTLLLLLIVWIGHGHLITRTSSDNDSLESEFRFCESIFDTKCECTLTNNNQLGLVCEHGTAMSKVFDQLARHSISHLDLLQFSSILKLDSGQMFPNITVEKLRLINCPHLKQISSIDNIPYMFQTSVQMLEIFNTSLTAEQIFQLIRQLQHLDTALLTIKHGNTLTGNGPLNQGVCHPNLRRLALNHRCDKFDLHSPMIIEKDAFVDLCNIEILELSCLDLYQLDSLHIGTSIDKSHKRIIIDLSYNQIKNITRLLHELSIHKESIILNVDHNPIEHLHKTTVETYLEKENNQLSVWQSEKHTVLECDKHNWLVQYDLETFCLDRSMGKTHQIASLYNHQSVS